MHRPTLVLALLLALPCTAQTLLQIHILNDTLSSSGRFIGSIAATTHYDDTHSFGTFTRLPLLKGPTDIGLLSNDGPHSLLAARFYSIDDTHEPRTPITCSTPFTTGQAVFFLHLLQHPDGTFACTLTY
jgi:hypothetical protein